MSSSKSATSKKAKGEKSKSQSKAQSKQRPQAAASALHQAPADASSVGRSCAFTSDGTRFVLVARAGATERVRVFDAQTGRLQSEAALDGTGAGTKVSCLSWVGLDLDTASTTSVTEDASRKKRKKRKSDAGDNMAVDETTTASSEKPLLVALGRADGSISLFSPSHGRLVRTLSHAQSTTPILALSLAAHDQPRLWTSSEDGLLRLWDARKNVLLGIWKTEEHTPFSALALSPAAFIDAPSALLAAHHGIRLLSVPEGAETNDIEGVKSSTGTLQATASCTGHASPVSSLQWVSPTQIASSAPDDRTLSFWTLPSASNSSSSSEGTLACTIPLSSPVRSFSVSPDASLVLAVSNGNVASIHALPASFKANEAPGKKIPTVSASASVSLGAQRGVTKVEIAAASFVHDQEGTVRIVRLVGGVKPIFDLVRYLDLSGSYVAQTTLKTTDADAVLPVTGGAGPETSLQRYAEPTNLAVRSGALGAADDADVDLEIGQEEGLLDVDLAELSLGQRLKATESGLVNGADAGSSSSSVSGSSSDEEEGTGPLAPGRRRRKGKAPVNAADAGGAPVPASTLTRTLIQALHSADAGLLESCLAHSQPQLILASVARLPPQLALPLIDACVLRLGRGSRGSAVKGGGGGASAQRATALVAWVKAALAAHAGTLMGMPDAVARLAGLHAVMAQRAGMRGRLEGLMGRLDVVVSQVEMRGAGKRREGKAVGAIGKVTVQDKDKREVRRYVEGESSDEDDEDDEVDGVDVEVGSDAGSIEDVELGVSDDSDDDGLDDDEEDDEEEDDSEEDGIGGRVNGFVDDEAEEYDEDSDASDSD